MKMHERAKQRIEELGLKNQEAIAKAIGIKQPSLSAFLNGDIKKPRFIVELAHVLKTTPEWLQTGKGGHAPTVTENSDDTQLRDDVVAAVYEVWAEAAENHQLPLKLLPKLVNLMYNRCSKEKISPPFEDIKKRVEDMLSAMLLDPTGQPNQPEKRLPRRID